MFRGTSMARPLLFLFVSCILLSSAFGRKVRATQTCGSLITYRQYPTLLETAPRCFLDGCARPPANTSMSDTCPAEGPCFDLWSLLRDQYQTDWCATCKDDIACRIHG